MYTRTIVCLANSRKSPSGRCIAGKEWMGERCGQWLRPVSARHSHEISEEERRFETGKKAQLLDIVTIPLNSHVPFEHQTENHVIAEEHYWNCTDRASYEQVNRMVDAYDPDFWIDADSTRYGLNDKITEQSLPEISCSLKLISVSELSIIVHIEDGYEAPARRRVRAEFDYHDRRYRLSVTDPEIEDRYLQGENGRFQLSNALLCISLTGRWHGNVFRLVASVMTHDRAGG